MVVGGVSRIANLTYIIYPNSLPALFVSANSYKLF